MYLRSLCSCYAILVLFLAVTPAIAADLDFDGIDDAIEQAILTRHAPVWIPHDNNQRPPLPLDWYVRHCQLRWYDQCDNPSASPGTRLGDSGNQNLSLEQLANYDYSNGAYYRLAFKQGRFQDGDDPSDPITWSGLQSDANRRVVLGRVSRIPGASDLYTLMYFLLFGKNVTDAPNNALGICTNWGDHEGDVIGVEFTIHSSSPATSSQLISAVYNNHGRKIFIDDAVDLDYQSGRPVVYMERESQEPWPVPGHCGFGQINLRPSIGTNMVLEPQLVVADWSFGGECEDFQAVREHQGNGTPFVHTNVT